MDAWQLTDTLPPPGERPGRVFVIVEGQKAHSGLYWRRQGMGIARTSNDGFDPQDVRLIEKHGDMDAYSGTVTHWLPINLPPFPE